MLLNIVYIWFIGSVLALMIENLLLYLHLLGRGLLLSWWQWSKIGYLDKFFIENSKNENVPYKKRIWIRWIIQDSTILSLIVLANIS